MVDDDQIFGGAATKRREGAGAVSTGDVSCSASATPRVNRAAQNLPDAFARTVRKQQGSRRSGGAWIPNSLVLQLASVVERMSMVDRQFDAALCQQEERVAQRKRKWVERMETVESRLVAVEAREAVVAGREAGVAEREAAVEVQVALGRMVDELISAEEEETCTQAAGGNGAVRSAARGAAEGDAWADPLTPEGSHASQGPRESGEDARPRLFNDVEPTWLEEAGRLLVDSVPGAARVPQSVAAVQLRMS